MPSDSALDRLIRCPRLTEIDRVDLAASAAEVWNTVRHGEIAHSPAIRALFALRTIMSREASADVSLRVDDLTSTPACPGFQLLLDDAPREFAVGAIGKVWRLDIPFVHVATADEFAGFEAPGYVKVAWAVRVSNQGASRSHLEIEVRVDATDDASWTRFRRYFRLIGPGSRFIRRSLVRALARRFGGQTPDPNRRPLPGDELLPDAGAQITHQVDVAAAPGEIWPWLVQMGCGRGGFYSIDQLDNAGLPSAREIHPELQSLAVGDVIAASPDGEAGFEVLGIDAPRVLVLGGLWDAGSARQVAFTRDRPERYWHVTWAFVLEPLDARTTRLIVRARGAFPASERLHASWIRPVHHLMESAQLRNLAMRAEGRLPATTWRDVWDGIRGASSIASALATPFMRRARSHWGIDAATAARRLPGDELVAEPAWSWTHGVEVDADAEEVWPWVAQIGADRGGFYSYQWLENLAGCRLRNAEVVHPEWEAREGQALVLHPDLPPMRIVSIERGRFFVAHAGADAAVRAGVGPWVEASWLFLVEPIGAKPGGEARCRVLSRYRVACSTDLRTRLFFGPTLVEPLGFAMDRRMLAGIKARAERSRRALERQALAPGRHHV